MRKNLTAEVTTLDESSIDEIERSWRAFDEQHPAGSYFSTPDWVLGWFKTLERDPSIVVLWTDAAGDPAAFLGLVERRERLHSRLPITARSLHLLGATPANGDHLGMSVRPDALDSVVEWLTSNHLGRTLHLAHADPTLADRLITFPGNTEVLRTTCPRLSFGHGDGVPASFAKKLRQYERRLERENVSFEWIGPGAVDEGLLLDLATLHEMRWEDKKGASSSHLRNRIPFFLQLNSTSSAEHGPVAVRARCNGDTVGVLFGFWHQGVFSYFQTGWDPEWKQLSLGTALVARAVAETEARGGRVFDFLRGTDSYKYRFGAVDSFDKSIIAGRGLSGALLRWK